MFTSLFIFCTFSSHHLHNLFETFPSLLHDNEDDASAASKYKNLSHITADTHTSTLPSCVDFIFSTHKTASSYFTLHRGKYLKSQVFPSFTSGLYVFKCCYNHERKNWVWENHKTAVQYKIAHILRLLGIQSGRWSRLWIGRTDKKSSVA